MQVRQFWTFRVSGAFRVWLLGRGVMFQLSPPWRHFAPFCCQMVLHPVVWLEHVVCRLHGGHLGRFTWGHSGGAAVDTSVRVSVWTHVSTSLGCRWERLVPGPVVT